MNPKLVNKAQINKISDLGAILDKTNSLRKPGKVEQKTDTNFKKT